MLQWQYPGFCFPKALASLSMPQLNVIPIHLATAGVYWLFVDVYFYTSSILAIIFQLEDVFCRKSWGYETDTFGEEPLFLLVVERMVNCSRGFVAGRTPKGRDCNYWQFTSIYTNSEILGWIVHHDAWCKYEHYNHYTGSGNKTVGWKCCDLQETKYIGICENARPMASRMRAAAAVARMRQKGWEEEHRGDAGRWLGACTAASAIFCHWWKESCHPTQLLWREMESVLGQMT